MKKMQQMQQCIGGTMKVSTMDVWSLATWKQSKVLDALSYGDLFWFSIPCIV
jgi:hypothetical protein